jgi:hypothetical protein
MPRASRVQGALEARFLPFCNLAMHVAAWGLLRAGCSPLTAHRVLCRAGTWLPPVDSPEEARVIARSLLRHGTCLTRSVALAARAPSADVVIGVTPRGQGALSAHAWIEMGGTPIDPADVSGLEIARLRGSGRAKAHDPLSGPAGEV